MQISEILKGKLLKSGIAYTVSSLLLRGISFFTTPLFIRILSTEEYGKYSVFISYESIIFIFSGLAIHASVKNAKIEKEDAYDKYVANCIYLTLVNCLLIYLLLYLFCSIFHHTIELTFSEISLLIISGFSNSIISIYSAKLIMEYKTKDFVIISFISTIFSVSLSLLFIYTLFTSDHYFGRILGSVLGLFISSSYILYQIFKNKLPKIDLKAWKYGLKISLPIVPHGLSQIALSSCDRLMISYLHNNIEAGIYSFTYTISLIPQLLFSSISNIWEPWFFENMKNNNTLKVSKVSTYFCFFISVIFVLMSFIVPEVVKLLATKEYYQAIDVSIIVLIGLYFSTLYYIPCEVEYYFKKTQYIASATILAAIINIALNYWGLLYYSYKIVAWVTLLTYFLYFIFHMYMSCRIYGKSLFELRKMFGIIFTTCILMFTSFLSVNYLSVRLVLFILTVIVSTKLVYHIANNEKKCNN